jgi:carbamate kinase
MRVVIAIGGNALLRRDEKPDADLQLQHLEAAATSLVPLAHDNELLICHGNGPQVGLLALESQADTSLTRPYPLDVLGAQTQGMIGYWLGQALRNAGVTQPIVSVLTQTVVDRNDPAFHSPSKFIGKLYPEVDAHALAAAHHWIVARDGQHWRRVVPSPEPLRVVEQGTITQLLDSGTLVICGGGGGAPVTEQPDGQLRGVEAVVDKDLVAAMLAITVDAHRLLLLTDVPAVLQDYGTPQQSPLRTANLDQLATMTFPAGSMGPKIEACRRFVLATRRPAAIGALTAADGLLEGTSGTTVTDVNIGAA